MQYSSRDKQKKCNIITKATIDSTAIDKISLLIKHGMCASNIRIHIYIKKMALTADYSNFKIKVLESNERMKKKFRSRGVRASLVPLNSKGRFFTKFTTERARDNKPNLSERRYRPPKKIETKKVQ